MRAERARSAARWRWLPGGVAVLLGAVALSSADSSPKGPPPEPQLRIEAGMHTAQIRRIDVDAAGRFLVTGSDDKTARVWDLQRGELLRVLRPPIGAGNEGKVYAVAISPDGERVAVGGWMGWEWDGKQSIYLFERRSGRLERRIPWLPNVMNDLSFSPDGRRLAATLGGANGLRVFRAEDGKELFRDAEVGADSYGAAFDAAGRLVISSYDGQLRLYTADHRRLATREAPGGKRPYGVAFSPDGRRVAVGYGDSTRVDVLSGSDLAFQFSADTRGTNGNLSSVAWSADGASLFAAGRYFLAGEHRIRRWEEGGRGPARDLPGPGNTVLGLHSLADGRLLFGSMDPAWGVLSASGERGVSQEPPIADFRGLLAGFQVDRSGRRLRFAYAVGGKRPALFTLAERRLTLDPPAAAPGEALASARTSAPGLAIEGWQNTTEPKLGGQALPLKEFETSCSLAIAADGQSFLLGTEWYLWAFRADGSPLWPRPVPAPGVARAVQLTADGRLALAAFGDGTIRWYRAADGVELLAFFPHRDGKRWVLWTPSGYYDASVDGEDLIGWHVNRGPEQAADFFSAWHFRDRFRRPDVVDLVLETLDEAEALRRAGVSREAPAAPPTPLELPPVVTVLEPADGATVSTSTVKLRLNVRSPSGAKVDRLELLRDGRPLTTRDASWQPSPAAGAARDFYEEREVPIPPQDTTLEVVAEAGGRVSAPARVRLRWAAPTPATAQKRLRVLAVGVSKSSQPRFELGFAARDAEAVARAWEGFEGRLYREVETRVLTDAKATQRAILEGLQWLGEDLTSEDVAVLFLAGHGINQGSYSFLPHDADLAQPLLTLISESTLRDVLNRFPGQVLVFLDTCRAGQLAGTPLAASETELRRLVDVRRLTDVLTMSRGGVVVYAAAGGGELSLESKDWGHGAFTKALLEALAGAADADRDGEIMTSELEGFLARVVRQLTDGSQTPIAAKPGGVPDFVVAPGRRP